ncbi:unnamed protein product [marine sediment metagenome]|uniref:Uncharacterized protein n=1 Tax=marine sediment metagenome TaxID=412755 RepID=X1VWZ4_9ZZZZ
MSSFMARSARHFLVIKAARLFRKELNKAGLDNLKTLAEGGISIVGTYLEGCSPSEKTQIKRDLGGLLQMGVTSDMIFEELIRQMPELAPIIEGKKGYKKTEVEKLLSFLKE